LFEPRGSLSRGLRGIAAPDRRAAARAWAWSALLIGGVLYGSLLPFEIDWSALTPANGFGLLRVAVCATTAEDLVTNILLYMPVGLALAISARCWHWAGPARAVFAVLGGAVVSLGAEMLQTALAVRVASWTDVAMNTLGAGTGAVFAVTLGPAASLAVRRWNRLFRDRPARAWATALAVGLLLLGLIPFDFATNTAELHANFGRARWDLFGPRSVPVTEAPFALLVGQLSSVFWFAILGGLLVASERESGACRDAAMRAAILQGVVLATVLECAQLFTMSHVFDSAVVMLRTLSVTLGAWCVAAAPACKPAAWRSVRLGRTSLPMAALAAIIVAQVLARLLEVWNLDLLTSVEHAPWVGGAGGWASAHWLPFETLWRRPMASAASEAAHQIAVYGTLACALGLFLVQLGVRWVWVTTGAAVVLVAVAVEALQCWAPLPAPDTSGPALAILAVALAARLWSAMQPVAMSPSPATTTGVSELRTSPAPGLGPPRQRQTDV
jgi:glycopeptide antibiotics resistance protein